MNVLLYCSFFLGLLNYLPLVTAIKSVTVHDPEIKCCNQELIQMIHSIERQSMDNEVISTLRHISNGTSIESSICLLTSIVHKNQ